MIKERSMRCAVKMAAMLVIIAITVFAYMLPDNYVYADSDTVIKTVEVTLHANGGSFKEGGYGVVDTDTCVVKFDVYEDREPSYVNVDMRPSREGKVLIGWSTDKDAQWETWTEWFDQLSEESGMYEFALPMDGSVKDLYAVWADLYPITLNANGGSFGTKTDRYGNVSKIETFDLEFWNEKGGRVYKGSTALPDIDTDDMNGLEHVGWSADKNAKRPEYGKDFEGLELNASTPEILYAVFGDPKEGNATIIPKQTVYNFDLNKNKTGRIEYSVYWDGFMRPNNYSTGWDWKDSPIGTDGKYEFNKVLFMTGGDGDGFSLKNNVFVNNGWLEFEMLEKGSVKLIVYAKLNDSKVESQVITVNVTDGTQDPTIPSDTPSDTPEPTQEPESKTPISINKAKVVLSATSFTYNGKVKKPKIKTIGGKTLKAGTDYTIKWSKKSPKNVGTYTVTITGKDSYTGTTKATFKINPKGTSLKTPKSLKKAVTIKWKKQTAKMGASRITGYQIQLATNSKFTKNKRTVTTKGYNKDSKKVTKLKAGKKYYIRIRTYKTVNGKKYYSKWSKAKTVTTKK